MKNKIRKVLVLIILMILILSIPGSVQANVQSRGDKGGLTNKSVQEFFELIRQMETSSGPMGLSATIEQETKNGGTTILETSTSNNIDVHMIKNTEWGTVAILVDSVYGSKNPSSTTTTGNNSGVKNMVMPHYVAGMWDTENDYNKYIYYADEKYWNKYTEYKAKIGDATIDTSTWGIGYADFVSESTDKVVFLRGYYKIFSYLSCQENFGSGYKYYGRGLADSRVNTRATIVNGTGF